MIYSIKKDAIEFRSELGFGNTDAIKLKSLLIKLDIIAVFKPLPERFSAMAIKTEQKNFILINSDHSIGRQNFSICHELYHLYIQKEFTPHHCKTGVFNKKLNYEYHADVFASYFLMPEDGILSLIPDEELKKDKILIDTILKIEHYFACSRTALLYRLKELNLISSKSFDHYSDSIKHVAKQYGYSTDLYESGNQGLIIGNYGSLAKHLYDSEKISEGHYHYLMHDIGIDLLNSEDNVSQN
jgi:Zn-dependent peptidase ImmA (M78 family)